MKVRFTPQAEADLTATVNYIRRDRPSAARSFRLKVIEKLSRLESFPKSGRHLPEYPDLPVQDVIISPYRFFYHIKREFVWILAVWNVAQSPDEPTV